LSDKWFSNHGHAVGTFFTIGSFLVALLANWNAIQEHQNVIAWWPVLVIPITVYLAFRIGRSSQTNEPQRAAPAAPPATTSAAIPAIESTDHTHTFRKPAEIEEGFVLDSVFLEKKTIKLGDYWELKEGMSRLKVTPVAFKEGDNGRPYIELKIATGGSVYYGGDRTIKSGVNRIALPETSSGFQAEEFARTNSVFLKGTFISQHFAWTT
jgi:hypothetical protein